MKFRLRECSDPSEFGILMGLASPRQPVTAPFNSSNHCGKMPCANSYFPQFSLENLKEMQNIDLQPWQRDKETVAQGCRPVIYVLNVTESFAYNFKGE